MVAIVNDNDPVQCFSLSNHQRAAFKCDDSRAGVSKVWPAGRLRLVAKNLVVRHLMFNQQAYFPTFRSRRDGSASAQLVICSHAKLDVG